ncbi:MAG: HEAT repeat domain-containing protein, partial [Candidatus Omnitrophica bacterium]|nr:HEAT repeat domain-containing protein [Candidatus Omnitrophota bacterium]
LLEIKHSLYTLFQSGLQDKTCLGTISKATVQQFLDIKGNRRLDAVFFNQSEQELFKECFIHSDTLKRAEETAGSSRNRWHRIEAILALGYAGKEGAVRIIREALNDKDPDIAYFSAIALGQLKTEASADALLDALRKTPALRRKIASILEAFPFITDKVMAMAEEKDPVIRFWAIKLISKLKPGRYRGKIEAFAEDPSDDVRAAACECLGVIGDEGSEPVLVKHLKDDAWFVRMYAVRALSKTLGERSIPIILKCMHDGSLYVLGSIKTAIKDNILTALPYFKNVLDGGDSFARSMFLEAIESSLMETEDASMRRKILDSLRQIDGTIAEQMEKWLNE